MCLFPRIIKNRKYEATKKNGGVIPPVLDSRVMYVTIGCQKCIECMNKRARDWQVRLLEEVRTNRAGEFVTLTFSNESIKELAGEFGDIDGYELDNAIATLAVRRFLERWRKKYKTSVRHWLVTELGHNGTENIHLHGIIWKKDTTMSEKEFKGAIRERWGYGHVWAGYEDRRSWIGEDTVNYITKYITKVDLEHREYKPKIMTSAGIGRGYVLTYNGRKNSYNDRGTDETYRTRTGHKIALPIYYRNKIYTESEREKLWIEKLDKNERWICGEKVRADDTETLYGLIDYHRRRNKELGYGDDTKNWNREQYERNRRKLLMSLRLGNIDNSVGTTLGTEEGEGRIDSLRRGLSKRDLDIWEKGDKLWTQKNFIINKNLKDEDYND